MQKLGVVIILGVLFWIFVATLPFLWWLWLLILGIIFFIIGSSKEAEKRDGEHEESN